MLPRALIPLLSRRNGEAHATKVNLHDAKTHLSRYVQQALDGDEVVSARPCKAMVRLLPVEDTPRKRHLGFLQGEAVLDCDLKADFRNAIDAMFG